MKIPKCPFRKSVYYDYYTHIDEENQGGRSHSYTKETREEFMDCIGENCMAWVSTGDSIGHCALIEKQMMQ